MTIETQRKFCPFCGKPHGGNYVYCSYCGALICDRCDQRKEDRQDPICRDCLAEKTSPEGSFQETLDILQEMISKFECFEESELKCISPEILEHSLDRLLDLIICIQGILKFTNRSITNSSDTLYSKVKLYEKERHKNKEPFSNSHMYV